MEGHKQTLVPAGPGGMGQSTSLVEVVMGYTWMHMAVVVVGHTWVCMAVVVVGD